MKKIIFSEKIILREKIYFLLEGNNTLYFFENNGTGFYIQDENNKDKFEWIIEEGILSLNGKNIHESWEIKQTNKEKELFIITIHKSDGSYDDILSWAFNEDDDVYFVNYNSIELFRKLNNKNKIIILTTFFVLFSFLFLIINNLFLIKDAHFLLKIVFLGIIFLLSKNKIIDIIIEKLNKKEKI